MTELDIMKDEFKRLLMREEYFKERLRIDEERLLIVKRELVELNSQIKDIEGRTAMEHVKDWLKK